MLNEITQAHDWKVPSADTFRRALKSQPLYDEWHDLDSACQVKLMREARSTRVRFEKWRECKENKGKNASSIFVSLLMTLYFALRSP